MLSYVGLLLACAGIIMLIYGLYQNFNESSGLGFIMGGVISFMIGFFMYFHFKASPSSYLRRGFKRRSF